MSFIFLILSLGTFLYVGTVGSERRPSVIAIANVLAAIGVAGQVSIPLFAHCILAYLLFARFPHRKRLPLAVLYAMAPLALLHLGLSWWQITIYIFYCLQITGAIVDVHLSQEKSPKRFSDWFAFSLFFPCLVAGPILRWKPFSEKLRMTKPFTRADGIEATKLLSQGIFKRAVFAVPILTMLKVTLENPGRSSWGLAEFLTIAFFLRVAYWAEIDAYTNWAQAASKLLGLEIPKNFNRPFQTFSLTEFWRRWHSSISSWIYDYVVNPIALGFLRRKLSPRALYTLAISAAFCFLGAWHGFEARYFVMGLWKCAGVLVFILLTKKLSRPYMLLLSPLLMVGAMYMPTLLLELTVTDVFKIFDNQAFSLERYKSFFSTFAPDLHTRPGDLAKSPFILFAFFLWQLKEYLEFKSVRMPALFEIILLFVLSLALGTLRSDMEFQYVPPRQ